MNVKQATVLRFQEIMKARGIRPNELANLSGVTPSTVYSMLDERRKELSIDETNRTIAAFPPESERMNIEEMMLGYTINGAKQLGVEAVKGSIEAGKDADFLVFDNNLLEAESEGFSQNAPAQVYIGGKKVN